MKIKAINILFLTFCFYCFIGCGNNYYYNEQGILRPKNNNFNTEKLEPVNYELIDTSAIYLSDNNWFFKFYGDNKCAFFNLKEDILSNLTLDPSNGKMGYFEVENSKLITYIFVNNGNKFFNKKKYLLDKNLITNEEENYVKKTIPDELLNWKPNW